MEGWNPEIRLEDIYRNIKQNIWMILVIILSFSFVTIVGTLLLEEKIYQATSTVIMSKEAAKIFYEDEYTKSDIDLYQQVGNTYIQIANSNRVIDGTIELLNQDTSVHKIYTRKEIKEIVSANYISDTLIIKLLATSTAEDNVSAIANAYRESFIDNATTLLPAAQLVAMDVAETPQNPMSSGLVKNTMIACILGVMVSAGIIFAKLILSKNYIQTNKEVKQLLDVEVLSVLE